jgi:ion channel
MAQISADHERAAGGSGRTGRREPGGRYGLLLLVLILTYLLSAFTKGRVIIDLQLLLFLVLLLLALRTSRVRGRTAWLAAGVALAGSAAAFGAALTGTEVGGGIAAIWKGLVLLLAVGLIISRVLARPTVTVQSIYGALSAYVILGMMYAAFFAAIKYLGGGGFFANGQPANTQTYQYFSFSTLTTLGYGDFTSAINGGRAVAVLEAMTGQIFLATLVARLVSAFRPPAE